MFGSIMKQEALIAIGVVFSISFSLIITVSLIGAYFWYNSKKKPTTPSFVQSTPQVTDSLEKPSTPSVKSPTSIAPTPSEKVVETRAPTSIARTPSEKVVETRAPIPMSSNFSVPLPVVLPESYARIGTLPSNGSCGDKENIVGLCYTKCTDGYSGYGALCSKKSS
jgi:hypothetical protein